MRRSNAHTRITDPNNLKPTTNMDSIKNPLRPNPTRSTHRNPKPTSANTKLNLTLFTIFTLILVVVSYLFVFSVNNSKNYLKNKYAIVIDGGSTGTRIHVFGYRVRNGLPEFDFVGEGWDSMRVKTGLSAYADDPDGAGRSVAGLVEFGRKMVPEEYWKETEVRLMATAGMRLLEEEVQGRILEACRRVLRSSRFKFRDEWASVISGSDEGLYAWVIANYALGSLGGDPHQTTGIIELGGASAQVTFVSSELMPPEFSRRVKYGNFTYNLYSHSLLQFGQNVALELMRESLVTRDMKLATDRLMSGKPIDPCIPKGYTHDMESWKLSPSSLAEKNKYLSTLHPSGNFSECRSTSLMLLQNGKDKCSYQHCAIGSTFIPKLRGKFLATENFFYTSKFFGLAPRAFLSDLMVAGQQFCEEDWSKLKRKYHSLHEDDLLRYCFSSAYIVALLHDSLGIGLDDERIGYANQVRDIPLDWALGAFILQTAADLDVEHSNCIATIICDDFSTFLALSGIALMLMFTAWYVSRCRKPHLKTIYDLEKGKYIFTRINRC